MKKTILYMLVLLLLIFTGCGRKSDTQDNTAAIVSKETSEAISTEVSNETSIAISDVSTASVSAKVKEPEESKENKEEAEVKKEEKVESKETVVEEKEEEKKMEFWDNKADVSWIDTEKKMVAITFDDGPVSPVSDTSTSIRIQNALSENGMHATFFYWGLTISESTKKEMQRAYELGFELGNHTSTHPNLTELSDEEVLKQIEKVNTILNEITGEEQFLIRPPFLATNEHLQELVSVPLISCALDTKDWDNASTEDIINTIKNAVEKDTLDGKIVLAHETYKTTAEAMEYLIPYLKEQGYQVVTVSELYKARGKNMVNGRVLTQCAK